MCSLERTTLLAPRRGPSSFQESSTAKTLPRWTCGEEGLESRWFVPCWAIHCPHQLPVLLKYSQAQSAERHSSIGASHHGNPWLPSPTHCLPSLTLLADSQDCLLSSRDLQTGPAAPLLQVWLLSDCSSPRCPPSVLFFPWQSLGTLSLGQNLSGGPASRGLRPQMGPIFILATVQAQPGSQVCLPLPGPTLRPRAEGPSTHSGKVQLQAQTPRLLAGFYLYSSGNKILFPAKRVSKIVQEMM